jgi:hypothetical protein
MRYKRTSPEQVKSSASLAQYSPSPLEHSYENSPPDGTKPGPHCAVQSKPNRTEAELMLQPLSEVQAAPVGGCGRLLTAQRHSASIGQARSRCFRGWEPNHCLDW